MLPTHWEKDWVASSVAVAVGVYVVSVASNRAAATDLVAVLSTSSAGDDSGVTPLADNAAITEVSSVATDGHVEVVGRATSGGVETNGV